MSHWPPLFPKELQRTDHLEMYHPLKQSWIRTLSITPCKQKITWEMLLVDTWKGKIPRRVFRTDGPLIWTPIKSQVIQLQLDPSQGLTKDEWLARGFVLYEESLLVFAHTYHNKVESS